MITLPILNINISPVHFIALPLFAAFLIPLIAKFSKSAVKYIPGLVLLYLSFVAITLFQNVFANGHPIVEVIAGWKAPLGINLYFGAFSGFLVTLGTIIGFLSWAYSLVNMKQEPLDKFYMLFMLLIAGATGIILTGDVFNLFVFLEITGISAYALTAFLKKQDTASAGFKYTIMGGLASAFILIAIIILYTQTGTLNMADMASKMSDIPVYVKFTVLIFFLVGIGIEAEVFPLNGWAPDAYSAAPMSVGAVFAGVVVKGGVYAMLRIIFLMFDFEASFQILAVLGLLTMIVAEISAMKEKNLKKMLAFFSIGQMGLVLIAFSLGTAEGAFGGIFQMFNHAIIKPMLFFAAGYLLFNSVSYKLDDLNGFAKKKPFASFIFAFGALAIIGLPPFAGFWSKFYILTALAGKGQYLLVVLILIAAVIEAVYYLRIIGRLYLPKEESLIKAEDVQRTPVLAGLVMVVLAGVILLVGVYPEIIAKYIRPAADVIVNKTLYIQEVVGK